MFISDEKKEEIVKLFGKIIVSEPIETGGASGGSCWGGEAASFYTYRQFEGAAHLTSKIEDIVEKICPNMSFLQYRKLMRNLDLCVSEKQFYYSEWYGNFSEGFYAELEVANLFSVLEDFEQ